MYLEMMARLRYDVLVKNNQLNARINDAAEELNGFGNEDSVISTELRQQLISKFWVILCKEFIKSLKKLKERYNRYKKKSFIIYILEIKIVSVQEFFKF